MVDSSPPKSISKPVDVLRAAQWREQTDAREGRRMHALGRFLQERMDAEGWRPADLARASGVSKQVISKLLDAERETLTRPPAPETIAALADAFRGAGMEGRLWARVAQSMGLPAPTEVPVPDPAALSNTELIAELARRLDAGPAAAVTPIPLPRPRPQSDDEDDITEAAYEPPQPPGPVDE